jgi:hypothetical protein
MAWVLAQSGRAGSFKDLSRWLVLCSAFTFSNIGTTLAICPTSCNTLVRIIIDDLTVRTHMESQKPGAGWVADGLTPDGAQLQAGELGSLTT